MKRVLAAAAAILVVLSMGAPLSPSPPEPTAPPSPLLLWEAYTRGWVTVRQVNLSFPGGQGPLGYEVKSTATQTVLVDDLAMLLSPNPADPPNPPSTTQDGVLTKNSVPPGGTLTYGYGDFVAQGLLTNPPWWCTEQFQFVRENVEVALGGEILPFAMEPLIASPQPFVTQDGVWAYLRTNPSLVVGKAVDGGFWREIPETAGQLLQIALRATNLAIKDTTDNVPDPNAPAARVWDRVPAGYAIVPGSVTAGFTATTNPDGSTTLAWTANIPAADVTGWVAGNLPTPYQTRTFQYQVRTPHLLPGRYSLPRAEVSAVDDGTADAHSAFPILEPFRVNQPPLANAGGPYGGQEGDTIAFSAAGSTDPNGDALQYRWDFEADGTWDTGWSTSPIASSAYGDDFVGSARVQVSDGEFTTIAVASVTVRNVDPSISADAAQDGGLPPGLYVIRDPIRFTGTASDPGSDDLALGWSWGDGTPDVVGATHFNDGAGPDPYPSPDGTYPFGASDAVEHVFAAPGAYEVTVTVTDDDGGASTASLPIVVLAPDDLKDGAIARIKALKELAHDRGDWRFLHSLDQAEFRVWKSLGYKHPFRPDATDAAAAADVDARVHGHDHVDLTLGPTWDSRLDGYGTFVLTWSNGEASVVDLPDGWPSKGLHVHERFWVDAWWQDLHIDAKREGKKAVVLRVHAHDASLPFTVSFDGDPVASLSFTYEIRPWWVDATHLDPKDGHHVFSEEKKAVKKLVRIEHHDEDDDGSDPDEKEDVIACRLTPSRWSVPEREALAAECDLIANLLVKADELLARVAIGDAQETPVKDPKRQKDVDHEIAKALTELEKGYEEWDKRHYDHAIQKFRKAWEHAQHATKHATK